MARTIDAYAVYQIAREAIGAYAVAASEGQADPFERPEISAIVRCLAIVAGGDYHVGFDPVRRVEWERVYGETRRAVQLSARLVDYRETYAVTVATRILCLALGVRPVE